MRGYSLPILRKMIFVKGKDNRGIVLLGSNIDGANDCSTGAKA